MPSESSDLASSPETFTASWRLVTWAGVLGSTYYLICVTGVPRIKFLTEMNATAFEFGLIASLGAAALLFQIVGAFLAQRLARRKTVWMTLAIIHRMVFLLVLAAPLVFIEPAWRIAWVVGALFLHDAIAHTATPLWLSWMADLVPQESITRHWASRQRFITAINIGSMIALAFGFDYFERTDNIILGYSLITAGGVVLGVWDIFLFIRVPEPEHHRVEKTPWLKILLQPIRDREFRPFLLYMGYFHFAIFFAAPFFGLYTIDYLGMTVKTTQLLGAVGVLGMMLTSRFWGLVCDTYGYRPVLQILGVGKAFAPLAFLLIPRNTELTIPLLVVLNFVDGAMNSGMDLAIQGTLLKRTPRGNRTMYIAAANFIAMGVMAGLTPVLAGQIIDVLNDRPPLEVGIYVFTGYHGVFALSTVLRLFAFIPVARMVESRSVKTRTVLRLINSVDSYRVTRLVYILHDAIDPKARREAARKLGALRNPLAIMELIHRLRDSDVGVRESAAEALGAIGVAEAAQPLAEALFDQQSGIQSPAARALGQIGGLGSMQALLRSLSAKNAAALHDIIESLARIGDDNAVLPLIGLFHEVDDQGIREHVAKALGRIVRLEPGEDVMSLLYGRRPADSMPTP